MKRHLRALVALLALLLAAACVLEAATPAGDAEPEPPPVVAS